METLSNLRTEKQADSLHLWFDLLADALNEAGMDLKVALRDLPVDVPATKENVKSDVWKPLQWATLKKKSTKQLEKKEIDVIYDIISRHFAQKGVEVPRFPSETETQEYLNSFKL